jgi:hypothetical protein
MCLIIINYDCGHFERDESKCHSYLRKLRRAKESQGFWKSLIRLSQPRITCSLPSGRKVMYRKCPLCIQKDLQTELSRRKDAGKAQRRAEAEAKAHAEKVWIAEEEIREQIRRSRKEHEKLKERKEKERQRKEQKRSFFCSACTKEGRNIGIREREANGGCCCARGVEEFEAWEKGEGERCVGSSFELFIAYEPPLANIPRDPTLNATSTTRYRRQGKGKSDEAIRADARAAAERYGWGNTRDSSALEPEFVRQYVSTSGADARELPQPARRAMPVHQELLIDEHRWGSAAQTAHGRLPPTPEKPLPVLPLRSQRVHRNPFSKLSDGTLPPLVVSSQAQKIKSSHSSPRHNARLVRSNRLISELGHGIDNELKSWKELGSPVEQTRFNPR